MRQPGALVFAALLASSVAFPAFAALDHVGSVDFSARQTHDADYSNFTGEALALTARNSSVVCDSVTATFGNGRTRQIFSGQLPRGQTVTVDLPGRERNVDRLDFNCRPTERWRGSVDIAADTGPNYGYRDRYGRYDNTPMGGMVRRY